MAVSEVSIANDALSRLGEDRIASLDAPGLPPRAKAIKEVYTKVRDACLRRYAWGFAIKRASLPADATTTVWGALNRFPVPSDFIRLIRDDESGVRLDWKVEGRFIVTRDAAPLNIKYVSRVEDPTAFDPLFVEYFALALAVNVCKKVTGSNGLLAELKQDLRTASNEAKQANAFEKEADLPLEDDWVLAGRR